jgi:AcrR family transcriptional regulator
VLFLKLNVRSKQYKLISMTHTEQRQRAPSRRSLETRERILDAAERLFAQDTYAGTSIRDIAAAAGVPVALVSFHGGSKEALFESVVERRAEELSSARLEALQALKAAGEPLALGAILRCFIQPYLEKAAGGSPQWPAYARLVAQVSADERWRAISERCFDPTARLFLDEIAVLFPQADPRKLAAGFVFTVAAMLSLATSQWRIDALSRPADSPASREGWTGFLVAFCENGLQAAGC